MIVWWTIFLKLLFMLEYAYLYWSFDEFVQEGDMMKAVVYLELATRAGERPAAHVKNVILQRLSAASRDHAMVLADRWRALPSC